MSKKTKHGFSSSSQEDFSKHATVQLSDDISSSEIFPNIDQIIQRFREPAFSSLTIRKRFRQINQTLYELIHEAPPQAFLLSAVLDFLTRVNQEKILNEILNFASFEFWLNNFSSLSESENYEIRAKIVGKFIPREEYQVFFPIGMANTYPGTHFITAHLSPDVDTMIASFWGWIDAFGARVSTGLHSWCLPGGPPDSPVTAIFRDMFGIGLFPYLSRTTPVLMLTAMDLVTQKQVTKELGHTVVGTIEHGSNEKVIILVNEQGHYLGDWRSSDVEVVRQIIILFKSCLHWFENNLYTTLISLFAKEDLSIKDLSAFSSSIFDIKIKDCEPVQDFNEKQKNDLHDFFYKVLGVEKGLEGTFQDLTQALDRLSIQGMLNFQKQVEALPSSDIFDERGRLRESRPIIFNYLKKFIKNLDEAIFEVRNYVERLDIVLSIKYHVLKMPYIYITLRSDVDEMRQKMQNYDFLTVVIHEQDGSLFPVGIVRAQDLRKNVLGTVTLRDFCNLEEMRMASYLEVISVIDHHKSSLKTLSVPTALIGDAQSCNVLIAEQAFMLNDKYSLGGMDSDQIDAQIQEISSTFTTPSQMRILQRLLQRRLAAHRRQPFYVHPRREFNEYLCFLHAILDDTDLLTKVSHRDLECVAHLLNRLKSLSLRREVEIINFDDIPRDKKFVKTAAQRLLQQADMYSLYSKIYDLRESEVDTNLVSCIKGHVSNIFLDAKEQNGCARVGQTKMFASNFFLFLKHASEIRQIWLNLAQDIYREQPDIDLHIHMISTIASADEVYRNQIGSYQHQDELWFWIPATQQGYHHLNSFLAGFQYRVKDLKDSMSLEFLGSPTEEFVKFFVHHFPEIPRKMSPDQTSAPMTILRFMAGALNSRKSMITPYLPRII
jgi:hypothetical protein